MMSTEPIRVGQFGFTFRAQFLLQGVPLDISGATAIELRLEKPDGSVVHLVADLESTGLDGWAAYLVLAGDIDQAGSNANANPWRYQFIATQAGTWSYPLSPVAFDVIENIP